MKKILAVLCALCMIFALCACGQSAAPASAPAPAPEAAAEPAAEPAAEEAAPEAADKVFNVGVCQLVQHPALDAATEGFKEALTAKLGDKVTFLEQNASGDSATCATICNQFVSEQVDLIMANATPALQAAANATSTIPVLATSITDFGSALGIENWTGVTGTNVSGTSDLAPLDGQAAMVRELFPDAKTVGILFCDAEANSLFQADTIQPMLEELGFTVSRFTFSDSSLVSSVTESACSQCDVLYIPTDNTAASCAEAINNVAQNARPRSSAGKRTSARAAAWPPSPSATTTSASPAAKWPPRSS